MRLYSLANAAAIDDSTYGHFDPAEDGGFDFPPALEQLLHSMHVRGQRQWETDIERQRRLIAEEAARRADPATLLDAVLALQQQAAAAAKTEAEKPKTRRVRKAAETAELADSETGHDDAGDE